MNGPQTPESTEETKELTHKIDWGAFLRRIQIIVDPKHSARIIVIIDEKTFVLKREDFNTINLSLSAPPTGEDPLKEIDPKNFIVDVDPINPTHLTIRKGPQDHNNPNIEG